MIYKDISSVNDAGIFMKLFCALLFLNTTDVFDCFIDGFMTVRPTDDVSIVQFMDVFDNIFTIFRPSISNKAQFSTTVN